MGRVKPQVDFVFLRHLLLTRQQGNVVQAFELARRYSSEGIVSIPLNPGNIKTDLARHMPSFLRNILVRKCSTCSY
jgi:hypothetical protein